MIKKMSATWKTCCQLVGQWPGPAFGLGIFITAAISSYLSAKIATPHFIWLPNVFAMAFVLRQAVHHWVKLGGYFLLPNGLVAIFSGLPIIVSVGLALSNVLEVGVACFLFLHWRFYKPGHLDVKTWFAMAAIYMLIAAPLGAISGGILLGLTHNIVLWAEISQFWLGSTMGFLLLSIPLLTAQPADFRALKQPEILARITCVVLLCGLTIYGIFRITPFPFIYCILPFALLTLRFNTLHSALMIFGSCLWAMALTLLQGQEFPAVALNSARDIWGAAVLTCFIPLLITLMVGEFHARQQQVEILTERLTLANKAVSLGVWEWHVHNHSLWWDEAMYQQYGIEEKSDPVNYQRWRNCVHPDDISHIERLLKDIARGKKEFSASFRILNPRSGLHYMQAAATIIAGSDGKPLRYVGMSWDVTPIKEAEIALQKAKQKAEVASLTKSEFVANMSHEIRTPLNATLGTVQLLHNTPLNVQQHKYLEMIKTSGESLLAVLNDILDFSKIEAGHMEIAPTIFNLNELIARLANMMSVNAGEKDLELIINLDASVPRILEGDALRLQQILVNLTSNAIRFTPEGEVLLKVELVNRQEDWVDLLFAVKDTGIGIAKHKQLSLFDAFTQADSSTTRQYGGTGLGLSIARRLINLMGGELFLSSDEGQGAEFYFTIRLRAAAQTASVHHLATRPLRVMVVDDNPQTLSALSNIMHLWYWEVVTAQSAHHALDIFEGANRCQKFDVVMLDWRLLDSNGVDLLEALNTIGLSAQCARILMDTSHGRIVTLNDQAGFDALLVKPVTHSQLIDGVNEALAKRRGQALPEQTELRFPTYASLEGLRLLLAEDNPLNQTVAKGLLEQFGAQVTLVNDGAQAVAMVKRQPNAWDAILLDVQMPVMDGYTACEQLLAAGVTTPIIAMTAGVMASERAKCMALGMAGFIAKPIDVNDMLKVLTPLLSDRPSTNLRIRGIHSDDTGNSIFYPERLLQYLAPKGVPATTLYYGIESLIAAGAGPLETIESALNQGHFTQAAKLIHNHKGSLGNLGAMAMYRQFCQLENLLRHNQLHTGHPAWCETQIAMTTMLAAATSWLERNPPPPNFADASSQPTSVTLGQLRQHLGDNDLKAIEVYELLKAQIDNQLPLTTVQQLSQAINQLNFAQAILCLDEIA